MPRKNPNLRACPRRSGVLFSAALWPKFELAPHHRQLVQVLERVECGLFDRVIVTMPPRHGKSLITSQLFPGVVSRPQPGQVDHRK